MRKYNSNASYGQSSQSALATVNPLLASLFTKALPYIDHGIIEGYRNKERQNELFASGLSHLTYPNGKHNKNPSDAVDAYIWYPPFGYLTGHPDQLEKLSIHVAKQLPKAERPQRVLDWIFVQYAELNGIIQLLAQQEGLEVRWGGQWNDHGLLDQTFDDIYHWELVTTR